MEEEFELDRSCWSVSEGHVVGQTYKRAGLDTVFTSLDGRKSVMSIRVSVTVELRPTR
jgi:hypothetical protein